MAPAPHTTDAPSDRDTPGCTSAMGEQLVRVVKLLSVARSRMPRQHPLVDPMAYPLLFNLHRTPMRLSALAELVHADVSTVSRQVSLLVEHGFVTRGPDPEDGRAHVLTVSDSGSALLADIRTARDTWLHTLTTEWSDDDVRAFTDQLARLAGDLETHLSTTTTRNDS